MSQEEEILKLLQGERKQAERGVALFYKTLAPSVVRYFVWRKCSKSEAEDLLQETIVKIYRGAPGVSDPAKAGGWFWSIAKNCLRDFWREKRRTPWMEDIESAAYEVDHSDADLLFRSKGSREAELCVLRVLESEAAVSMPDRTFALLRIVEGASIRELSEFLNRSTDATKQYLYECRKKMRPFLQPCLELLKV